MRAPVKLLPNDEINEKRRRRKLGKKEEMKKKKETDRF